MGVTESLLTDLSVRAFSPDDHATVAAARTGAAPRDPASTSHLNDVDEYKPEAVKRERWLAEQGGQVMGVREYTQSNDLYHQRKFQLNI
jgi:hypothetical protein